MDLYGYRSGARMDIGVVHVNTYEVKVVWVLLDG